MLRIYEKIKEYICPPSVQLYFMSLIKKWLYYLNLCHYWTYIK